jgi:DNA-binding beta-propeller fold protein YncE
MKRILLPKIKIWLPLGLFLLTTACMDDDSLWLTNPQAVNEGSKGVFIVNEGNLMYNNASLSYYDIGNDIIYNDVFFNANALPLGDVALSMQIRDSLGYIVVNNSGRIYIIDINTFELKGKITGLTSPRHIHFVSETKAYVSDLYARAITIINLQTLEIEGTIETNNPNGQFFQHSSEQMVQYGDYVFTNSWSFDNKILVIDTRTDQWITTLDVGIQPRSMIIDRKGKFWVLCDGGYQANPFGHENPSLLRINPQTFETEQVFEFDINDYPRHMTTNAAQDTIYFVNRHLWRKSIYTDEEPDVLLFSPYQAIFNSGFYSVGVDPVTSQIYLSDARDMVQPGLVYQINPSGEIMDTLKTGIIPGWFSFKK